MTTTVSARKKAVGLHAFAGAPQLFGLGVGGVLLSHTLAGAVPSALSGLASGFGMGPGVSPTLSPPTSQNIQLMNKTSHPPGYRERLFAQGHIVDAYKHVEVKPSAY